MKAKRTSFEDVSKLNWLAVIISLCISIGSFAGIIVALTSGSSLAQVYHDAETVFWVPFGFSLVMFLVFYFSTADINRYYFGDLGAGTTKGIILILAYWGALPIIIVANIIIAIMRMNYNSRVDDYAAVIGINLSDRPENSKHYDQEGRFCIIDDAKAAALSFWNERHDAARLDDYTADIRIAESRLADKRAMVVEAEKKLEQLHQAKAELEEQVGENREIAATNRRLLEDLYSIDGVLGVNATILKESKNDGEAATDRQPTIIQVIFQANYRGHILGTFCLDVTESVNDISCKMLSWNLHPDQAHLVRGWLQKFDRYGYVADRMSDMEDSSWRRYNGAIRTAQNKGRLRDVVETTIDYVSSFSPEESSHVATAFRVHDR